MFLKRNIEDLRVGKWGQITQFPKHGLFPGTRLQRPLPTYQKALGTCPNLWATFRYRSGGFAAEETGRFQIDQIGMLWNIKMPPADCRTVENSQEAVEIIVMMLLMNNLVWTRGSSANKLKIYALSFTHNKHPEPREGAFCSPRSDLQFVQIRILIKVFVVE